MGTCLKKSRPPLLSWPRSALPGGRRSFIPFPMTPAAKPLSVGSAADPNVSFDGRDRGARYLRQNFNILGHHYSSRGKPSSK